MSFDNEADLGQAEGCNDGRRRDAEELPHRELRVNGKRGGGQRGQCHEEPCREATVPVPAPPRSGFPLANGDLKLSHRNPVVIQHRDTVVQTERIHRVDEAA